MGDRKLSSIGSYPADWTVVPLDTVAELRHGYQFRTYDFTKEGIKVFKITQIKTDGGIDISSCDYIDSSRLENFRKYVIQKGDILMALSGATIGKIAKFNSDEIVLQNYRVGNYLPLNEKVLHKDYFYYFLSTEYTYQQILANQTQSAQENVGKEDIHKMLIFLPPFSEQQSIASILSSLDDKIDLLHRQNKTLEALAETLFRRWFVEEGTEYILIGNVASVTTGKGLKREEFIENGEFPILGANGEIGRTNKFLTESKLILTGRVGTLGKVYLSEGKVWISDNVLIVNPCEEKFFYPIYFHLKTVDFESLNVGSTQPLVTQTELKKIEFKIPTQDIFEKFTMVCNNSFDKIFKNKNQIHTLTQLRDTLLPKLMSGEVRVKN